MSNIWHDMNPKRITPRDFECVIEITKGSKKKYELDKECGLLRLDRILYTSTHYPANYGFIPRTYGDDNDPLDVLVLCSESIEPMTLVRCRRTPSTKCGTSSVSTRHWRTRRPPSTRCAVPKKPSKSSQTRSRTTWTRSASKPKENS